MTHGTDPLGIGNVQFFVIKQKPFQMALVGEVNKVGKVMDLVPFGVFALFPHGGQFFYFRFFGGNCCVATHAF